MLIKSDLHGAIHKYKEGINFVEYEENADAKNILKILRLNIAQAYLKTNQATLAIENCTQVLQN